MEIYGKKINNDTDLYILMNNLSVEKCRSVARLILLEQRDKAINRMNREKDPIKKEKMKNLIFQEEYDFDLLFGPEK